MKTEDEDEEDEEDAGLNEQVCALSGPVSCVRCRPADQLICLSSSGL